MSVSDADLMAYVGADVEFATLAQDCVFVATALVTKHNRVWSPGTETYVPSSAPVEVVDRAILEVAAELFHKKQAPNGIQQFAAFDGVPTARVARDSMTPAYSLLAPWVVSGF